MKIEIIPAIDLIDGKCVRLSEGDYQRKKIYSDQPLEMAKYFEDMGIRRLHLVDLDAANVGCLINLPVLKSLADGTNLHIDFGGGIHKDEDIEAVFEAGAAQITAGSIAVRNPEKVKEWLRKYGGERIILGADVKNGTISINAWQKDSGIDTFTFIQSYRNSGIAELICTDISRDGLLTGPALSLYKDILKTFPELHLIASGGVSSMKDIIDLQEAGIEAVIVGKAIYEGRITEKELRKHVE